MAAVDTRARIRAAVQDDPSVAALIAYFADVSHMSVFRYCRGDSMRRSTIVRIERAWQQIQGRGSRERAKPGLVHARASRKRGAA